MLVAAADANSDLPRAIRLGGIGMAVNLCCGSRSQKPLASPLYNVQAVIDMRPARHVQRRPVPASANN